MIAEAVLSNSLKKIGHSAFANCEKLKNIKIPDSVKNIGNNAFEYCSNLEKINFPESVENIGNYLFDSCENLTVKIPETLKNLLDDELFEDVKKVKIIKNKPSRK